MVWSFALGRIAGTVVRIHLTFVLLLAAVAIAGYVVGGIAEAADALAFVILLFACVVAHEFGHIFAARRYGISTPDVTVLPIGGLATLERMPEKSGEELAVALAGPAVNVVIAGVLVLVMVGMHDLRSVDQILSPGGSMIGRLTLANLVVAGFNLIPAFPMDGGRVLRALLAMRMSYPGATAAAAWIGRVVAVPLVIFGVFYNPLLVLVAVFVLVAAKAESYDVTLTHAARGLPVEATMITKFESLQAHATLGRAVDELLRTSQKEFPIVDAAGQLKGFLTRKAMLGALRRAGGTTLVTSVMTQVPTVHHRAPLDSALKRLRQRHIPALGVVDDDQRLIGLVTPDNIRRLMQVRSAWPKERRAGWRHAA
ncbi:MAG: site-2 protease family protein [Methylacidiphilales bacterium]|nr:site-2 protease family protein [Candidatus Methylacidiphilales bacterium]